MAAPAQGCTKKLNPCSPQPQGGRGQGVSNGKVIIVAQTHVGPEVIIIILFAWGAQVLGLKGRQLALVRGSPPRVSGRKQRCELMSV